MEARILVSPLSSSSQGRAGPRRFHGPGCLYASTEWSAPPLGARVRFKTKSMCISVTTSPFLEI